MASKLTRAAGAGGLSVVMTLVGHEPSFEYMPNGERKETMLGPTISYFPDGQKMISGSSDKTARLWNLQSGKEIEEARIVCEQGVRAVAASRNGRWVIAAGCPRIPDDADEGPGELKAYDVKTGIVKTFKGHSQRITYVDISGDSKLLASGSSQDETRIWDLETGGFVTSIPTSSTDPFESVCAIRFSQDSRRLAMMSTNSLNVFGIEGRKVDTRVRKDCPYRANVVGVPIFWTTKDRTIVAAFSSLDISKDPRTIYEFDSSTLEIVGPPFEGHTHFITLLALSFDCALLVSASSFDRTVKLWAFESRQILASFDVNGQPIRNVVLSPNARQLAYTTREPNRPKIYICDIPPDIVANLWPGEKSPASGPNGHKNTHLSGLLNSHATTPRRAAAQRNAAPAPLATQPLGYSPPRHQREYSVLRYLRKLFPSSLRMDDIRTVEPRDPLDCPATSSRFDSLSSPKPVTTFSRPTLPVSQSSAIAPSTIISRLHNLLNWRPAHTGDALPPIIDVALAQGQTRNAAAGAPAADDGCILDEVIDSRPPSRNSTSQRAPAGEHGSGRLCFCL